MNIKPGDIVKLKTGGPLMTVQDVSIEGIEKYRAYCTWFRDGDFMASEWIRVEALVLDRKRTEATSA